MGPSVRSVQANVLRRIRTLRLLILFQAILAIGFCLCLVNSAAAQETPSPTPPAATESQSPNEPAQQPVAPSSAETKAKEKSKKADSKKGAKKGAFVIAPLPMVSPAIGSGIVPVAAYIFPFQVKDKSSPPSVIAATGLITNNGSRAFGLGADLYLKQDRYELKVGYGRGNVDYNLYGVGFVNGNAGLKLPLEQTGQLFFIKFLRNIGWDFFLGARFSTGNSLITLKPTNDMTPPIPPDVGLSTNLRALGVELSRDSRKNRFYPLQGSVVDFTGDFFANALGSKYSFQSYKFTFNKFASFGDKQVLAYNLFLCGTGGEPPFYGNCIYGTDNELRGYTAGRYLDRYMIATQLEYRLVLPWRFGLVAFGGVGGVGSGADSFRGRQLLPAGGTGLRFLLSKKYHVNLRTDFAWGKDNFTWGMGVGEAF
jgi:Omp85 superfamily domain